MSSKAWAKALKKAQAAGDLLEEASIYNKLGNEKRHAGNYREVCVGEE